MVESVVDTLVRLEYFSKRVALLFLHIHILEVSSFAQVVSCTNTLRTWIQA